MSAESARPRDMRQIYLMVALGFGVMFAASSIKGIYQVYFSDIAVHFDRSRGDFAWSGALFMLATGLISPAVGWLSDRIGPLRTVLAGSLTAGLTLIGIATWPTQFWLFVLLYGFGAAFALAAMTYVPMGILVDRLFEQRKKGLAYAVISNGTAIGFIVLSPLWIWLQPQVGWISLFLAVGLLFLGPVALMIWFAARQKLPSVDHPNELQQAADWRAVRADVGFYALAFGFFGCGATMAFVDVHLIPLWQDAGTPRGEMGLSMSLLGVLELASGLAAGWLATRYDKHTLLGGFYLLRAAAMLTLMVSANHISTFGFAVVFGASYLGTVVLTSVYCFERYGNAVKGQVFGVMFMIHQIGAFMSVQLGAIGYDRFGSYEPAISVLIVLTILAAVVSWAGLAAPASRQLAREA